MCILFTAFKKWLTSNMAINIWKIFKNPIVKLSSFSVVAMNLQLVELKLVKKNKMQTQNRWI